MKKLGLPYMGSKRKLAKPLIDFMLKQNPKAKYFFDLFGGGGAMSFNALQRKKFKEVHYNEFNTGVVELLKKIRDEELTQEFYQWIDRETFMKHKDDDDWFGGLVKVVWSFGNTGKGYLFGKYIEEDKRLLHEIVVNECKTALKIFNEKFDTNIHFKEKTPFFEETINQRRLRIVSEIKKKIGRFELQQLERLEQLERLQPLEQLARLQHLERLDITNLSYEQVEINTPIDETIVYLDPPYKDTGKYQKDIDHDILYEYIKNSPYRIYMSSYEAPFECVYELNHRSILSATSNNEVTERLFCNKPIEEINELKELF